MSYFNSFVPHNKEKIFTRRAQMIYSVYKLKMELEKITEIFISNGYPEKVILNNIKHKIA